LRAATQRENAGIPGLELDDDDEEHDPHTSASGPTPMPVTFIDRHLQVKIFQLQKADHPQILHSDI
jgi:hypothetical protein